MATLQTRAIVFVAIFAVLGGAFRHNLANIQEHLKSEKAIRADAPPPQESVAALRTSAQGVIDAKVAAAAAAQKAAMDAMMGLGSAQVGVASGVEGKDNNTHKRNLTMEAVNAVHAANIAKKTAEDTKAKVTSMIDAMQELFDFASSFETTKASTLVDKAAATEAHDTAHGELMQAVIEKELAELTLMVGKIDAIKAAEKVVIEKDAEIEAGVTEGVSGAAALVYQFAAQLEERKATIESSRTFYEWPELMSDEVKTEIDTKTTAGVSKAVQHLDAMIASHAATFQQAMEALTVLGGSTKAENATAMNELVQQQFQVNIQKQKAEDLKRAVEECVSLITTFFAEFAGYKEEYPAKLAVATESHEAIVEQLATLHAAADLAELTQASGAFQLYQVMWTRYSEARAFMPADDEEYMALKGQLKATAVEVHTWLNEEFMYLCEYYFEEGDDAVTQRCRGARAKLIALLEKDNYWCDERGLMGECTTMKGGRQPNGKMCKWITPTDEEVAQGRRARCKQNSPPTNQLPYGRDHEGGAGIFY